MPLFEIRMPITATLVVECGSTEEAMNWADKIVATLEDENGDTISPNEVYDFAADAVLSEIKISEISAGQLT